MNKSVAHSEGADEENWSSYTQNTEDKKRSEIKTATAHTMQQSSVHEVMPVL